MEELVLFLFWKSVQVILNDVLETWVERVATAFGTRSGGSAGRGAGVGGIAKNTIFKSGL